MFLNNIVYEVKLLKRSHWLFILLASTLVLFAYATFNGEKNVEKRLSDIAVAQDELNKKDSIVRATLVDIEKGKELNIPYYQLPSEPMVIGYRHPRLAVMQPQALSFISTGQSDMYTHFKSPTVYGNNFALDYSEMVNPVQLLFGNFDLAFVIIYILPLIIIAFTFNTLSKRERAWNITTVGRSAQSDNNVVNTENNNTLCIVYRNNLSCFINEYSCFF